MTKEDFSPEDWQLVVSAPSLVGLAVSAASPSGPLGVIKEMFVVGTAITDMAQDQKDNPLIQAIMEDIRHHETRTIRPAGATDMGAARTWALAELSRVPAVLEKAGDGAVGDEYLQWLVAIAVRVAEAAKEGSVFGLGGEKVSDDEDVAIGEVGEALGIG